MMQNPIQSVRTWLERRRIRSEMRSFAGGGGAVPAAPVLSGTFVTPETAIGLTAVYCALNVISGDVACLPRHVYKSLDGGGLEIEREHPAEWLVGAGDPNEEMGRFRFVQTEMGHVLGRGNGYSEIVRENGFPASLEPLHPVKTLAKRTKSGKLYYLLDNRKELPAEDCLHLAGMGFDGISGYSAITLCRQSLGVSIASEQHSAAFFGNGATMGGVLKHPRRLGEAAQSNLRKTINQVHQGSQSAYNLLILEEGMDFADRGISPEDSQLIQSRQFGVLEVARLFRCPPHKLGDYSQAHLANVEESNLDYLATTILSWVSMIDDEATRKLLTRKERLAGLIILTDLRALLRGNTATRTSYYQTMRNMGTMSADDIRVAEGMNPLPADSGGDLYLVQAQYQPLKNAGQTPVASPIPPGSPATPAGGPPPKPKKKASRFNENHDELGRFAEGEGGGGSSLDSHPDVLDLKEAHAAEIKDTHKDYDRQQKEIDRDHARDVKDLERDQKKEAKELARDQAKEAKAVHKDPEASADDKANLADQHRQAREDLAKEHQDQLEQLKIDHAEAKQSLEDERKEALESLRAGHAEELAEVKERIADEAAEE